MNAVGAIGDFINTPCHTVALQGVVFHDQANVGDLSIRDAYRNIAARLGISPFNTSRKKQT